MTSMKKAINYLEIKIKVSKFKYYKKNEVYKIYTIVNQNNNNNMETSRKLKPDRSISGPMQWFILPTTWVFVLKR